MESEDKKPIFTKRLLLIILGVILLILIIFLLLRRCGNGGENNKVAEIYLTPTRINVRVGEQQQVYANVLPSDAKDSSVYWTVEDPSIASVDQNGVITGIKDGVTTVTATANDGSGVIGSATVTVGDDLPELEQIQLNKSTYTVGVGKTVMVSLTPVPATASLSDVQFSIADTSIATVDASGKIKGVKVGSTILTVSANGGKVQTTAMVKVVADSGGGSTKSDTPSDAKIPVSAINLTATETCYKLKVGNTYTIGVEILPSNATNKALTWEVVSAEDASDAEKNKIAKTYASVSDSGIVKGLKAGNVKIKITATSGVYSYFDIKVISSGNDEYCTTNNNGSSTSGDPSKSNGETSNNTPVCKITFDGKDTVTATITANNGLDTSTVSSGWTLVASNKESVYSYSKKITSSGKVLFTAKDKSGNNFSCMEQITIPITSKPDYIAATDVGSYVSGTWTNKTVTIKLSNANSNEVYYRNNNILSGNTDVFSTDVNENVVYKICAKNNSSNCGPSVSVNIKIDKTSPSCGTITGAGSSSSWATSRTVSVGCNDSGSGCTSSSFSSTWTSTTTTSTITIKDKLGNSRNCSVNVYVDATAPTISCTVNSGGTSGVDVTVIASDSDSGLASDPSTTKTITSITTYTAKDKAGNSKSCTVYVEKTFLHYLQTSYQCTSPVWKSNTSSYAQLCTPLGDSSSNSSSYTTCKPQLNKTLCGLPSDSTSTCYIKTVYTRNGCRAYSTTGTTSNVQTCSQSEDWYNKYECKIILNYGVSSGGDPDPTLHTRD